MKSTDVDLFDADVQNLKHGMVMTKSLWNVWRTAGCQDRALYRYRAFAVSHNHSKARVYAFYNAFRPCNHQLCTYSTKLSCPGTEDGDIDLVEYPWLVYHFVEYLYTKFAADLLADIDAMLRIMVDNDIPAIAPEDATYDSKPEKAPAESSSSKTGPRSRGGHATEPSSSSQGSQIRSDE